MIYSCLPACLLTINYVKRVIDDTGPILGDFYYKSNYFMIAFQARSKWTSYHCET